ncbi:hypothetical protein Egran_04250 [Elaphomyces granulatus]|uniref:Rhodopsin domain-containing protein n=1 Tax=Elaphomyces granulatus TaxID=519963 RepID=A0A232LV46_9EURO|nr:hypothetical protein Egran_04250 [Elaphomyces granulatus]
MASDSASMNSSFDMQITPSQRAQAAWEIANTGRITMYQFKVALGVLVGIAVISFIGRIFIRVFTRRRLYMDDGFLIFAFACLCGGTFILYERIQFIYLEFAVLRMDPIAFPIAMEQMDGLFEQSKWQLSYLVLLWTTVFAVKWCYFAFFHPFLRAMSKGFNIYYKFSIWFTVISWLFIVIGEQLITCPYVGVASGKCFPKLPASHAALLVTFWAAPILDALTDLMVISIPIVILRQSRMRSLTKIGLGCFLCLSAFMLSCSIIRAAATYYNGVLDYPWQVFWVHAEGSIGVTMGSITVYRSTLIGSNEVSNSLRAYIAKITRSFRGNKGSSRSTDDSSSPEKLEKESQVQTSRFKLPRIPSATLSGVRTLFGGTTRTKTTAMYTDDTEVDVNEVDYHAFLKAPLAAPKTAAEATATSVLVKEQVEYAGGLACFMLAMTGHQVLLHHRAIGSGRIED